MIRNIQLAAIGIGVAVVSLSAEAQSAPPPPVLVRVEAKRVPKIRIGDVGEFEPAIAAVDSGGRCMDSPRLGITNDQKMFSYAFDTDGKRTRSVNVVVDSMNQLVRYSDLRGTLTRSNADMVAGIQRGTITSLSLNAVQGSGMLSNTVEGESETPIQVKAAAFLDAVNLGVPRNMIEHVLHECARDR